MIDQLNRFAYPAVTNGLVERRELVESCLVQRPGRYEGTMTILTDKSRMMDREFRQFSQLRLNLGSPPANVDVARLQLESAEPPLRVHRENVLPILPRRVGVDVNDLVTFANEQLTKWMLKATLSRVNQPIFEQPGVDGRRLVSVR